MMISPSVETFLLQHCSSSAPLLLALSGGPDSLYLFYCLLAFRRRHGVSFHVAHVDHGWRSESHREAGLLEEFTLSHQVPFHLKRLDPSLLKGNLEAVCREERYAFFTSLCQQGHFQGVVTGHHRDDQAETIFKRLLEGAHWSRWSALQAESWRQGVRILRPLLTLSKQEIQEALTRDMIQAFDDPTNRELHYLRARLREKIFPWLNQAFGKQVQTPLVKIGEEAQELVDYFDQRIAPFLNLQIQGPWGVFLDLQSLWPVHPLEIKYLLRSLSRDHQFFLSRPMIEQMADALHRGQADRWFIMGSRQLWIDRRRLFIPHPALKEENSVLEITPGSYTFGAWRLEVKVGDYSSSDLITSWREGWQGSLQGALPEGNYTLGFIKGQGGLSNVKRIKKRWSQFKVPACLYPYFPLVWQGSSICHEFLTGTLLFPLKEGMPCLKLSMTHFTS